jgi:hypothetical protein
MATEIDLKRDEKNEMQRKFMLGDSSLQYRQRSPRRAVLTTEKNSKVC